MYRCGQTDKNAETCTPSKCIIDSFSRKPSSDIQANIRKYASIKTPSSSKCNQIKNKRKSSRIGWSRAFAKYSPTTESYMSPILTTHANLKPVNTNPNDKQMDLYVWALNMSEQLYYDNIFLLLGATKNYQTLMANSLRRNYAGIDMGFLKSLKNIILVGRGAFGSVYSCEDPKTKRKYAFKYLSAEYKQYVDHAENLLSYISERNSVIRAMDSPFVIKLLYSLQIKITGSMFLFFEFCVATLTDFINLIRLENPKEISKMLDENKEDIIQTLFANDPEALEISFIYIFELFCALDFLVKCNIIHQDIKPDNIMLSENFHLKIGDFGIVYKTRMIDRDSNKLLLKFDEIDGAESSNYDGFLEGSENFQDLEQHLMIIGNDNEDKLYEIMDNHKKFNAPKFLYEEEVLLPTFLVDTWAAGVTATILLFRGFEIFNPLFSSSDILEDVPRTTMSIYLTNLVARQYLYMNYVYGGLVASGGSCHKELMIFLASIFKPRMTRCDSFTKEKVLCHFAEEADMRYIDIDKFENVKTFKERNFTRNNVLLLEIPERIRSITPDQDKPIHETFGDLIKEIQGKRLRSKYVNRILSLVPGVTINNFF